MRNSSLCTDNLVPTGWAEEQKRLVVVVNFDESYVNSGFWYRNSKEEAEYMMQAADTNKVIAFLAAVYEATTVQDARDEFHRLANELRKASRQPKE